MKRVAPIIFGCMIAAMALAQDVWITPQRFYFTIRDIANLRFLAGDNFTGNDWALKDSVSHLILYTPTSTTDISASVREKSKLQLSLGEEGTYMLICNSTNTHISDDPATFDQYLRREGLDNVDQYRIQHAEKQLNGNVYSQHSIKTIFQVGGKVTDACLAPSILPLDILPEDNPYAAPDAAYSDKPLKKRFQVLYDGKPLNNVLVKTWYRGAGNTTRMDSTRTNRRGWITIERHPGPNLITCTYMERNVPDTKTQWQAYRASLSFEYSSFFPGKTAR